MSIDITIKQKGFFKKTLPLSVILGSDLKYGAFVNDALIKDTIGEDEIVIYHPEHIGRGFNIIWNENEKKASASSFASAIHTKRTCGFLSNRQKDLSALASRPHR